MKSWELDFEKCKNAKLFILVVVVEGGGGGGSLEFCNIRGDQKIFFHQRAGIIKNLQNLKHFQRPPFPVKIDTSLSSVVNI